MRVFLSNLQSSSEVPVDINALQTGKIASHRGWLDYVLGFDTAELTPDEVERMRPAVYRWSLRDNTVSYHKIHDAYILTSDGAPLISREATLGALYIIRNPLDIASSAANHWNCSIDEAVDIMCRTGMARDDSKEALPRQVRQRMGSWSEHVSSWVDAPDLNLQVIRYEDMISDPQASFSKAAKFLTLTTDPKRVAKAIRSSSFTECSYQEATNGFREKLHNNAKFFNTGLVGSGREQLTPNQIDRLIRAHAEVMIRFGYL